MAGMQIVPAPKNVEAQIVEMRVPLYSYGCEKKVKKALSHLRGIHSVHVDYDQQKVTVWGICDRDVVLATIRKKRRESQFWSHGSERPKLASASDEDCSGSAGGEAEPLGSDPDDQPAESKGAAGGVRSKSRRMWKKLFPLVLML